METVGRRSAGVAAARTPARRHPRPEPAEFPVSVPSLGQHNRRMNSYVVTGGSHSVGLAIVTRLSVTGHVVVLDRDSWTPVGGDHVELVVGDAADEATASRAEALAPLVGWVNNAAVFGDASLLSASASEVLRLIMVNLSLAVTGCRVAVNHYRTRDRPCAIVNVSSHQAQRPVVGALPYATAKAAIEGLTPPPLSTTDGTRFAPTPWLSPRSQRRGTTSFVAPVPMSMSTSTSTLSPGTTRLVATNRSANR